MALSFNADPIVKKWAESATQNGFLSPAQTFQEQDFFIINTGKPLHAVALIIIGLALVTFAALALTGALGASLRTGAMIAIPALVGIMGVCLIILGIIKRLKEVKIRNEVNAIEESFSSPIQTIFTPVLPGESLPPYRKSEIKNFAQNVFRTTALSEVATRELWVFEATIARSDALLDKDTVLSLLARVRLHDREFFRKNAAMS